MGLRSLADLRILVAHANTCVGRMSLKQITTRTLQRFRKIRNEESLPLMTPTSISTQILGPIFLCTLTHRSYHLPRFMLVHLTCTYPISLFYAFSTCAEIYLHDSKRKNSGRRSACARWVRGEDSRGDSTDAMEGGLSPRQVFAHNGNTYAGD